MRKRKLNIKTLVAEAAKFAEVESTYDEPALYGVTDGKAVGTYLEHKFTQYLAANYSYQQGSSASGIRLSGTRRRYEGYQHSATAILLSLQIA